MRQERESIEIDFNNNQNSEERALDDDRIISKFHDNRINQDAEELEYKAKLYTEYAWFLCLLSLMIPFIGILFVKAFKLNFEDLGPFGDFVAGSTVPLFTFASFILLTATLVTQQVQLRMQRQDLKLTRAEYAETNKAFKEQNKMLEIQKFENTFFVIIKRMSEVVSSKKGSFQYGGDLIDFTGEEYFSLLYRDFKQLLDKEHKQKSLKFENEYQYYKDYLYNIEGAYLNITQKHSKNLVSIFSVVEQVFFLLNKSSYLFNEEEFNFYFRFVIMELPQEILHLLVYDRVLGFGQPWELDFIKKHRILNWINITELSNTTDYRLFEYIINNGLINNDR